MTTLTKSLDHVIENRYRGDHGYECLMTIDCGALRYEPCGVCILTGDLCWISGGWPAGGYADVSIFRMGL